MLLPLANAYAASMIVDRDCTVAAGCAFVFIEGKIEKGDGMRFERLLKKEKLGADTMVVLSGPGGFMVDAMEIGAIVHERGFVTGIGNDAECASACADIWLAGKVRYAKEHSAIGVHAPSLRNHKTGKLIQKNVRVGDEISRAYYRRLGLTEAAIRYLLAAKGDDVTWLKADKADELGIVITVIPDPKKEKAESVPLSCHSIGKNETSCSVQKQVKTQQCSEVAEFDTFGNMALHHKCS
jgi:hypothetical protein